MIVLDSNIVIEFAQAQPATVRWLETALDAGELFALSAVSFVEVFRKPNLPDYERLVLEHWIRFRLLIDVDLSIARLAATISRTHRLKTVDSIIAATAILNDSQLASRDEDFTRVGELSLIVP